MFGNVSSGKLQTDVDVTDELLKTEDDYVALFDWLNDRATIKQDTLLNSYFKFKKEKGKDHYPYRWNYVEDKEYPCNQTRAVILSKLDKNEKDRISVLVHSSSLEKKMPAERLCKKIFRSMMVVSELEPFRDEIAVHQKRYEDFCEKNKE